MALTGLDIYKQLPKKNCGECGPPTCLAFAMNLAAGKASLESCPYVSDAAKEALASAAAPPIKLVVVGTGERAVKLGDEKVIFRHEKTFYNEPGIAIEVADTLDAADLAARVRKISGLHFERVGMKYHVNLVAIRNASGCPDTFAAAVKSACELTDLALILVADDPGAMGKALEVAGGRKPLIYAATAANAEAMVELAKKYGAPLAVRGNGLDDTAALADKIAGMGYKDLVLDSGERDLARVLADLTQIRRLSIKKKYRPLGYPAIAFTTATVPAEEIMQATTFVAKYASLIVLKACEPHEILPLLTWRQNIYVDPQKPIQVESNIHSVGNVNENSPVYMTTNFSLTYYSVEGEVEASKVPSYILPVNTDGTSVLTAWAAGKYSAEIISQFIKSCGIEEKVTHREIVIPGYVAVLSGKLQELSGWKVVVGPREAAGIPSFARGRYGAASGLAGVAS